jgi:isopentenyl diphosphate isomerase/L-lactate dehydrogenase-like FMN-dependent dehydrogenase
MPSDPASHLARRRFLRSLAASPLAAAFLPEAAGQEPSASPAALLEALGEKPIAAAKEAVNVFDFDRVARRNLPPAHYGYLATGVDDDRTLRANREGFERIQIRARHLVDVTRVDTRTELFGRSYESPLFLCPAASQKAFHPDGEVAVARAARAERHLQMLSTDATTSVEDAISARGEPVCFQLYPSPDWSLTQRLVKRAEAAGCPALVLTVDLPLGNNRDTSRRFARVDPRPCSSCHEDSFAGYVRRKPMFAGIDVSRVDSEIAPGMTWDFVKRLKDLTPMKLVLKGIVTREDAQLAVEQGADAVFVSNHGGRSEESGRAAVDCLPEVVEAVAGRVPVMVDGGFRRGTDIFKALALGAGAVGVGRPYLWGLAAFGQEGVEAVLRILKAELVTAMQTCGTPSLRHIGQGSIAFRG